MNKTMNCLRIKKTLTQYIDLEIAAGRVSSLVVSHVTNVIRSPH